MHSHYLSQHPPLGHGPNSHTPPMSDREMWLADYIVGRVIYLLDQGQAERDAVAAAALVESGKRASQVFASVLAESGRSTGEAMISFLDKVQESAEAQLKSRSDGVELILYGSGACGQEVLLQCSEDGGTLNPGFYQADRERLIRLLKAALRRAEEEQA